MKKSLEEDSNVNKNLLEALRKKQIEETHNLKDILKDDRIIGNCSHFLTETKTEYSSKTIDEQIFDKKPLQKPIYPDFSHVLSKHKVFHSEKEKYFLSQDNKKLIPQNESLLKPKKNEPKPDSFVESKPNTFAFYETPNPNIANLELMLMNLKNRSLEPNLLNMQGSKDSAFTILNFLGTVQSEISSYLYNLGMNSKHNNESKFEKINNFFTNLGNSNLLTPFLFPHLHVNNNSNIFSNFFFFIFHIIKI